LNSRLIRPTDRLAPSPPDDRSTDGLPALWAELRGQGVAVQFDQPCRRLAVIVLLAGGLAMRVPVVGGMRHP